MKKIIFLILIVLLSGCITNQNKIVVDKNVTSEINSDEYIEGVFVEEYDDMEYATTITFSKDGSFKSYLNVCKAMVDIEGTYIISNGKIYLHFPESTGFDFIDDNQPYIFDIEDESLILNNESVSYSCAYVDYYKKQ